MKVVKVLFLILLFSLIIGQPGAITVGPFSNMYVHDLVIVVLLISWLTYSLLIRKKVFIPSIFLLFFLFMFWGLFTLVFGGIRFSLELKEFVVSALFLFRLAAYTGVFLVAFNLAREDLKNSYLLLKTLVFSGVVFSIFGFIQMMLLPVLKNLSFSPGWEPYTGRLSSTFFEPNFAGAFIALNLLLVVTWLTFKYNDMKGSFLPLIASIFILVPALSLTLSRGAWLLFIVASASLGFFRNKFFWAFALIFLIATILVVPGARERLSPVSSVLTTKTESLGEKVKLVDQSALARLGSWDRGVRLFKENPVTGVGFNTIRFVSARQGFFGEEDLGGRSGAGVDSSLLFVLATTGVVGFLIFLGIGFRIFKDSFIAFRKKDSKFSSFMGLLMFSSGLGLLAESTFINSLFYPQIILWFFTMLGIFYAHVEKGIEVTQVKDLKEIFQLKLLFKSKKWTR